MALTHPSVNQDAGQLSKLDVGQTVAAEGERAPVADHDGARTPRDAGLGQKLYNFLGLYLFSYSQWNSSFWILDYHGGHNWKGTQIYLPVS